MFGPGYIALLFDGNQLILTKEKGDSLFKDKSRCIVFLYAVSMLESVNELSVEKFYPINELQSAIHDAHSIGKRMVDKLAFSMNTQRIPLP